MRLDPLLFFIAAHFLLSLNLNAETNLVINPSFSEKTKGWSELWSREPGKGKARITESECHSPQYAIRIEYSGKKDWSFAPEKKTAVTPGEIYEYSGWVRAFELADLAELNIVTFDKSGKVIDWMYSEAKTFGTHSYKRLSKKFIVPQSCFSILLRIVGNGKGISYWDDLSLVKLEGASVSKHANEKTATITGASVSVVLDLVKSTFVIKDAKARKQYTMDFSVQNTKILGYEIEKKTISIRLFNPDGEPLEAKCEIDDKDRIAFSLSGEGIMSDDFIFPGELLSSKSESWVIPMNEGLLIPSDDEHFETWPLAFYSGHGLCMPFLGLTDGNSGLIAIVEKPDDAAASFKKPENGSTSSWAFAWEPSYGEWSYTRKLTIIPVREKGYVGIAGEYRRHANSRGLVVSLFEKQKRVASVEKLTGAVDIWFWKDAPRWIDDEAASKKFANMLAEKGIRNVLWSNRDTKENIELFNSLGFLTGKYDIYQDVYSPDTPIDWVNKKGWPEDLVLLPSLEWMPGWVTREGGREYTGGVICSTRSLVWMENTIPEDLEDHPYTARFIDTTTASPLRECYNPAHPLTRSGDRAQKSKMLDYVSGTLGLVTGSETGMDWAVPYLHYFEGMMSIGPYRLEDAGYDLTTYMKPDQGFMRFQVGTFYRIPLFELVYHDCVVSYWYWGDSSNRIPEVWRERDLFNVLYATPPLWIVDPKIWSKHEERFLESYRTGRATALLAGGKAMTSHELISADHTVQKSTFAGGLKVWVNFGARRYTIEGGHELLPKGYFISEK